VGNSLAQQDPIPFLKNIFDRAAKNFSTSKNENQNFEIPFEKPIFSLTPYCIVLYLKIIREKKI